MSNPFLGEIRMFAGNFAPVGWAFCNGQILSIQQNTALFSLLGTIYGGDGVTTFALPNLQSRVPLHFGQGPGLSNYVLGEQTGLESYSLNINQMPQHSHPVKAVSSGGNQASPANNLPAVESTGTSLDYSDAAATATMSTAMIATAGGNEPLSVVQPVLALSFIIALQGIFPSRS